MRRLCLLVVVLSFAGCQSLAKSMGEATPQTRQEYVSENDLTSSVEQSILEGRVIKGMTHDQVVAALGKYDDYNQSRIAGGNRMQLVYESRQGMAFVYLEPDTYGVMSVTGWQNVCKMPDFCVSAP